MAAFKEKENRRKTRPANWLGFAFALCFLVFAGRQLSAAELRVSPASVGIAEQESTQIIVAVTSADQEVNAAESTITFPAPLLEVEAVSQTGIFSHWAVVPTIDNTAGTVTFAGGLPTPGFQGLDGTIITLTVKGKTAGAGQICPTLSRVLANDSLGTNVLTATSCSTVTVTPGLTPGTPTITSSTHPDESAWYANADAEFSWTTFPQVTGSSYSIDQNATTDPDETSEGIEHTASATGLADGIWYFHVRLENQFGWGQSAHYRVQIDTTDPTGSASIVGGTPTEDTTPQLQVDASDQTSGIASIEVIIDGNNLGAFALGQLQPLQLPQISVGDHTIFVIVKDAAGNSISIPVKLTIKAPSVIKQITNTITDVIPQPIKDVVKNITKPIADVVDDLKNNPQVVEDTKKIIEPIARAAAAIGIATAAFTLPAGLINAAFAFLRFGYILLSPILLRKKRKPWGTVIDSITGQPIKGAIVRLFETEFNKLKESQITDEFGRFGFLAEPGSYTIMAQRQGYAFPSKLTHKLKSMTDIYTGGILDLHDAKDPNISVTIPVDPISEHISERALLWKRIRDAVSVFLQSINWPLLIIGLLISIWTAAILPGTVNSLLVVLYALLLLMKIVQARTRFKSYGSVLDAIDKKPIDLAVVRVFNANTSTLATTRITNQAGKFSAIIQPGRYYVVVSKPPYAVKRTEPISLSKKETLSLDILLEKGSPIETTTQAPTPPPPIPPQPLSVKPVQQDEAFSQKGSLPPTPPPFVPTKQAPEQEPTAPRVDGQKSTENPVLTDADTALTHDDKPVADKPKEGGV